MVLKIRNSKKRIIIKSHWERRIILEAENMKTIAFLGNMRHQRMSVIFHEQCMVYT